MAYSKDIWTTLLLIRGQSKFRYLWLGWDSGVADFWGIRRSRWYDKDVCVCCIWFLRIFALWKIWGISGTLGTFQSFFGSPWVAAAYEGKLEAGTGV